MNLRLPWSKRTTRRLVIVGAVLLVMLVTACGFFRISHPRDLIAYYGMARECHPVWQQLALRRFGAGDSIADLRRRVPENYAEEFGPYGVYHYSLGAGIGYTGLAVTARDGRLIRAQAWGCTWQFTFFDTPDPAFTAQYATFLEERIAKFRQQPGTQN